MKRYSIFLERNEFGAFSTSTVGTDAFNAIQSIPGTTDVCIESEDEFHAVISFGFNGPDFDRRDEHLAKFHLRKKGL